MVNINGKEWNRLHYEDIKLTILEKDFDESFFSN